MLDTTKYENKLSYKLKTDVIITPVLNLSRGKIYFFQKNYTIKSTNSEK